MTLCRWQTTPSCSVRLELTRVNASAVSTKNFVQGLLDVADTPLSPARLVFAGEWAKIFSPNPAAAGWQSQSVRYHHLVAVSGVLFCGACSSGHQQPTTRASDSAPDGGVGHGAPVAPFVDSSEMVANQDSGGQGPGTTQDGTPPSVADDGSDAMPDSNGAGDASEADLAPSQSDSSDGTLAEPPTGVGDAGGLTETDSSSAELASLTPFGRLNGTAFHTNGDELFSGSNGNILPYGDTFYWYGRDEQSITVSSSTDLEHWTLPKVVISDMAGSQTPYAVYNANLAKYMVYAGAETVAWSDRPDGDFVAVDSSLPSGDGFAVYVDDDSTAYSVRTLEKSGAESSTHFYFSKLTEDYLEIEENFSTLTQEVDYGLSNPLLFKHDGAFFLTFGLGARLVLTVTDLGGPWHYSTLPSTDPNWYPVGSGSILELPGNQSDLLVISGAEWGKLSVGDDDQLTLDLFNTLEFDLANGTVQGSSPNIVLENQLSGLVLDTAGSENRSPVTVGTSTGDSSQFWSLRQTGGNQYRLVNVGSDRPLSFEYMVDPPAMIDSKPWSELVHAVLAEVGSPFATSEVTDTSYWQTFTMLPGPTDGTYELVNGLLGVYLGAAEGSSGGAVELLDESGPGTLWKFLAGPE